MEKDGTSDLRPIQGKRGAKVRRDWRGRLAMRSFLLIVACLVTTLGALAQSAARPGETADTGGGGSAGQPVELHLFFAETCPHCSTAKAFLPSLRENRPWLAIETHSVLDPEGEELFVSMLQEIGALPEAVPTFVVCGDYLVGFDTPETTGRVLAEAVDRCYAARLRPQSPTTGAPPGTVAGPATDTVNVPFLGPISTRAVSLPVLTVVLGGLDAFNPCAFFVLLFLLSLLVNARSRLRMAIVGGVFISVSGLMYFLFMAAWLNLFLVLENVGWITRIAGLVAVVIGLLGVKDFFLFKQGPSLSIPESGKESLFARIRGLLSVENTFMLIVGAGLLAIAANMYELICTSGFPLVFTRILTLHDLTPVERYGYLALYNIVYVVPLFVIVAAFVFTMGRRKLSEREGRTLKLVSGLVMLAMGLALLVAPDLTQNVLFTVAILAGAVVLALAMSALDPARRRERAEP